MNKLRWFFPIIGCAILVPAPLVLLTSCSKVSFETKLNQWLDSFNHSIQQVGQAFTPEFWNDLKNSFLNGNLNNTQQETFINILGSIVGIPNWVVEGATGDSIQDWLNKFRNTVVDIIANTTNENYDTQKEKLENYINDQKDK